MSEKQTYRFDCHEYTWSEKGISGYPVGWGIRASSRAGDRDLLSRIEKVAVSACVDRQGGVPVEELMYERSLGFIKTVSEPARSGKDHRKNVRVRIYQVRDRMAGPEVYLAPHRQWPGHSGTSLEGIRVSPLSISRGQLLDKYHLHGARLVCFLDLVFSCIGHKNNILFAVDRWEEDQYASYAAEVMLAVHLLLPREARKYAGYLSFSREKKEKASFCFQPVKKNGASGGNVFYICGGDEPDIDKKNIDTPWQYMCLHLAQILDDHDEKTYNSFLSILNERLAENREEDSSDFLQTIPWIFYGFFRGRGGEKLPDGILVRSVPQLCYWKAGGLLDESIRASVMDEVKESRMSGPQLHSYLKELTGGITSRTKKDMLPEIVRVLELIRMTDPGAYEKEMDFLEESHREIYRSLRVMTDLVPPESPSQNNPWISSMGRLAMEGPSPGREQYDTVARQFSGSGGRQDDEYGGDEGFIPDRTGVTLEIMKDTENSEQNIKAMTEARVRPDKTVYSDDDSGDRRIVAADNGIGDSRTEAVDDGSGDRRIAAADDGIGDRRIVAADDGIGDRRIEAVDDGSGDRRIATADDGIGDSGIVAADDDTGDSGIETADGESGDKRARAASEKAGGIMARSAGSMEAVTRRITVEEDQREEGYLSFLVNSLPQGFLTACMLFLSIYSIKIGHWKIALGMAGVWTIVMLNYQRGILEKKLPYPLWMVLGLALVEGLVISQAAWLLPGQKMRLLFFVVVGGLTLLSQLVTILRIVGKDR